MSLPVRRLLVLPVLFAALAGPALSAAAQSSLQPQQDRIAAHSNLRATTRLAGHVPVWAAAANDAGPVSPDTGLRLTFVLSRSAERQAAFTQLLADQQNTGSPSYHHWLTPQQIGTLYGPTQHDLDALTAWLTAQGLPVTTIAPSRMFVTVEAPISTVANALSTSFRYFNIAAPQGQQAKPHLAATVNPAIPAAFAAIISAISGLSDTPAYPMHHSGIAPMPNATTPQATSSSTGSHYIIPSDFAVLYDLNPVYQSGIDGTSEKIAILGRSRVEPSDITIFESLTSLPSKQPNVIVPPTGVDPGITRTVDQDEATFDVDRAISTAPGAQVDLIVANPASGGINLDAQYEIQTLRDPIMSISFSSCETTAGSSGVTFWDNLFSQAAAEGISVFVSSGDSGAAECQTAGAAPSGVQARSINVICASSYVTCVGGTEFADFVSPSTYWKGASGGSTPTETAISYIPEGAWNEPTGTGSTPFVIEATGGGASTFITKPTWQTGTGVPADGFRDVPDVSFSSSVHDGYLICLAYSGADCVTRISFFGGTSGAAPSMAGIAALLAQKAGGPQGNLNPFLYRLAASRPAAFHDATPATSGVACNINTASICNNSTPSGTALTGGLAGFALTTGYDQATGLGSLDVNNFVGGFVGAESISVTPASSSLTVAAGAASGNTDLLTIGSTIYGGNVALGCTVTYTGTGTAASIPICSVSPSTVAVPSDGSITSTLTLATSARASAAAQPATHGGNPLRNRSRFALAAIFLIPLFARRRLRSFRSLPTLLLLLVSLGALSACSGSSTPASPNPLLVSGSSTTVAAAVPALFVGATDTFAVTVANSGFNTAVVPTGTVQFFYGGSATPAATATLAGGTATAPITFATAGAYTVTAVYKGDNNFSTSQANTNVTVMPLGTTAGPYTVAITATTPSGLTATTNIALTVR
jgi:pseudomonalisin